MADFDVTIDDNSLTASDAPNFEVEIDDNAFDATSAPNFTVEIDENKIECFIGGLETQVYVPFTFATASPLLIRVQLARELIVEADIGVTTAFDDATSTLELGSPATPGLVFAAADTKPKKVGQWHSEEIIPATTTTTIQLVITPGTSTVGAGYVFLQLVGL